MTVDLNRLREARESEYWDVEVLYALGEAALDAPTVWWCVRAGTALDQDDSSDRWCYDDDGFATNPHSGCGWVALVPVKGGQDAS